jgi:hypothetical protein
MASQKYHRDGTSPPPTNLNTTGPMPAETKPLPSNITPVPTAANIEMNTQKSATSSGGVRPKGVGKTIRSLFRRKKQKKQNGGDEGDAIDTPHEIIEDSNTDTQGIDEEESSEPVSEESDFSSFLAEAGQNKAKKPSAFELASVSYRPATTFVDSNGGKVDSMPNIREDEG